MDRVLTLKQIEERFESEWVLVEDPETNDALEVQSGKVLEKVVTLGLAR